MTNEKKNPTRVRVLADGETKEWSVLQPEGTWPSPQMPMRLVVRAEPGRLLTVEDAPFTSASETAEYLFPDDLDEKEYDRLILRRADARWLLDVLPAALDHANQGESADAAKTLYEDQHPLSVLTIARQVARELRQAKLGTGSGDMVERRQADGSSIKVWTKQECELLGVLCSVLGVDRHDGGLEE